MNKRLIQLIYEMFIQAGTGNTAVNVLTETLTTKFDYDGGTNVVYLGTTKPGTATSTANWMIKKFSYDSNSNVTDIQFAEGANTFNKIWDSRATYSYS